MVINVDGVGEINVVCVNGVVVFTNSKQNKANVTYIPTFIGCDFS